MKPKPRAPWCTLITLRRWAKHNRLMRIEGHRSKAQMLIVKLCLVARDGNSYRRRLVTYLELMPLQGRCKRLNFLLEHPRRVAVHPYRPSLSMLTNGKGCRTSRHQVCGKMCGTQLCSLLAPIRCQRS